jgi:NAD(P)-dependent dehydrogenase (short-subunit alcohol dehydrogenase family)
MELYDRIMNINLRPIFLSAKILVPLMLDSPGASFVNISSTGYTRPRPGFAFYNASKAGLAVSEGLIANKR